MPPFFRPRLETLESRDVPSAVPVRIAEIEPNDTYDTAQQLPDQPALRISGRTTSTHKTTIVDLDGYQFTTTEPNETVILGPQFATGPVKPLPGGAVQFTDWLDIRVYAPAGNLLLYRRYFQGGDYTHSINLRLGEAGKYSVVVGCGDCFGADVRAAFRYSLDIRRPALERDLSVASAGWDPVHGGVKFSYNVSKFRLPPGQTVGLALRWASGPTLDQAIGPAIPFEFTPLGHVGTHRVHVPGTLLKDAPEGATHLLVIVDPDDQVHERNEGNNLRAFEDVKLLKDASAVGDILPGTQALIKPVLREIGQQSVRVSSMLRSPEDQARIMFDNCYKGTVPNYRLPGRQVNQVYYDLTRRLKKAQIKARRAEIQAAMTAKIYEVGPRNVSHHVRDDSNPWQVLDIRPSSFGSPAARAGFVGAMEELQEQLQLRYLGPSKGDPAYHVEIPLAMQVIDFSPIPDAERS